MRASRKRRPFLDYVENLIAGNFVLGIELFLDIVIPEKKEISLKK